MSGDQQSYAPFQALKGDTRASVEARILQYYNNRLFQLSQPAVKGGHWSNRGAKPAAVAAVVTPDAAPEATS